MGRAAALTISAAALLFSCAAQAAPARCDEVPPVAASWLTHHPDWRIVTVADLNVDDQAWWRRHEQGRCPGIAVAHLDASSLPHIAVALMSRGPGPSRERIMLFHHGQAPRQLTSARVTNLAIVRREAPGRYDGFEGGTVHLAHDGISVEYLETSSQLFYLKAGRLRNIWTSD